jgi:biopolymer transport protein ExbB/TolQ
LEEHAYFQLIENLHKLLQIEHQKKQDKKMLHQMSNNLHKNHNHLQHVLYKLEKNLAALATISGAAPMIGFLGTVIGMILAFHKMANAGGQINVEMLSQGIYTAMATTVAGLIVGIVAYIGYNMLVSRVEKVIYKMEARSTEFLDLLHTPVK